MTDTRGLTTRTKITLDHLPKRPKIQIGDRARGRCVTYNRYYTGRVTGMFDNVGRPADPEYATRYRLVDTGETDWSGNPVEPIVEVADLVEDDTSEDLVALTDAELREQLDDALLAEHEPVDDMTTDTAFRENLPELVRALMDETHERAIAEDVKRELADVDTDALPHLLRFAELVDEGDARTAIALRVLRAEIDRRAAETPREVTPLDRAEAILAHVRKHGLHKHLLNLTVHSGAQALLYTDAEQGESAIAAIRPWIISLDAKAVSVSRGGDGYHIHARGTIGDELPFSVTVITRRAETHALDKATVLRAPLNGSIPVRLLDACERPIPRDHIPSADCWCEPGFDQDGQFFKHPTDNGAPAKFEPPIVPGAEQDADGYAREDHR